MKLFFARKKFNWVNDTVVWLTRNGLDHPAAELWHQVDVVLLRKVTIVECVDEFWASVGQLEFLLFIDDIYLIFHFFAPLKIFDVNFSILMRVVNRAELQQTVPLVLFDLLFVLIVGEDTSFYVQKSHLIFDSVSV